MAAQPAREATAAGGQEQARTARRAARSSPALEKKQRPQLLGTDSYKPHYSARPRRAAAAAALQGIQVMATSSGEEEDASDGEPAVGKAGSVSAGKVVGLAPGSRGVVLTSTGGELSAGWVEVMDLGGRCSAAAAAAGGGGEAD